MAGLPNLTEALVNSSTRAPPGLQNSFTRATKILKQVYQNPWTGVARYLGQGLESHWQGCQILGRATKSLQGACNFFTRAINILSRGGHQRSRTGTARIRGRGEEELIGRGAKSLVGVPNLTKATKIPLPGLSKSSTRGTNLLGHVPANPGFQW